MLSSLNVMLLDLADCLSGLLRTDIIDVNFGGYCCIKHCFSKSCTPAPGVLKAKHSQGADESPNHIHPLWLSRLDFSHNFDRDAALYINMLT